MDQPWESQAEIVVILKFIWELEYDDVIDIFCYY